MQEIPYNVPEFCDFEKHSNKTMLLMKERDRDHDDIHDWDCTIYLSKTALIISNYTIFRDILLLLSFCDTTDFSMKGKTSIKVSKYKYIQK